MLKSLSVLLTLCLLVIPSFAWSDTGTVVQTGNYCDTFVAKVGGDYAVITLERGARPTKDQQIEGRFLKSGRGSIQVTGAEKRSKVFFEAYPVSEKRAKDMLKQYC